MSHSCRRSRPRPSTDPSAGQGAAERIKWADALKWVTHKTGELLGEAARLAWGEVPGLDQPADRVGEGLPQGARLELQLVAGLRVVATGIAVHDPDAFCTPGQSRPQPALHEVCRASERGEKPGRERYETDTAAAEVAQRSDDVGHRHVVS